jgi:hypothetical protein
MLNIVSQLVTYKIPSVLATSSKKIATNVSSYLFRLTLDEERLQALVGRGYLFRATRRHIPRSCRMLSVDALPSNGSILRQVSAANHARDPHLP